MRSFNKFNIFIPNPTTKKIDLYKSQGRNPHSSQSTKEKKTFLFVISLIRKGKKWPRPQQSQPLYKLWRKARTPGAQGPVMDQQKRLLSQSSCWGTDQSPRFRFKKGVDTNPWRTVIQRGKWADKGAPIPRWYDQREDLFSESSPLSRTAKKPVYDRSHPRTSNREQG